MEPFLAKIFCFVEGKKTYQERKKQTKKEYRV
jgi:hypothetical protein